MPPKLIFVSRGAGITEGLELWRTLKGQFVLVDKSADKRFTADVTTWKKSASSNTQAPSAPS